jgi:hypothetical protein
VLAAACDGLAPQLDQDSRGWAADDWQAAVERLAARGWSRRRRHRRRSRATRRDRAAHRRAGPGAVRRRRGRRDPCAAPRARPRRRAHRGRRRDPLARDAGVGLGGVVGRPPEEVATVPGSHTGRSLAAMLSCDGGTGSAVAAAARVVDLSWLEVFVLVGLVSGQLVAGGTSDDRMVAVPGGVDVRSARTACWGTNRGCGPNRFGRSRRGLASEVKGAERTRVRWWRRVSNGSLRPDLFTTDAPLQFR